MNSIRVNCKVSPHAKILLTMQKYDLTYDWNWRLDDLVDFIIMDESDYSFIALLRPTEGKLASHDVPDLYYLEAIEKPFHTSYIHV